MFQLSWDEWRPLKSQPLEAAGVEGNRSQIATDRSKHRDPRLLPFAFPLSASHFSVTRHHQKRCRWQGAELFYHSDLMTIQRHAKEKPSGSV
jgi:hypothetical protein